MLDCEFPGQLFDAALFREIVIDVAEVTSDHCAGDNELDRVTPPNAHDLDVLSPRRIDAAPICGVDAAFNGQNESLQRTQRCMADTNRRVVGKGDVTSRTT